MPSPLTGKTGSARYAGFTVKETLSQMQLDWANRFRHEKAQYLDSIAQQVIVAIKKRTALSLDIDGKPFTRYSKSYEQRKKSSKVDLGSTRRSRGRVLKGKHMMDSMEVRRVGAIRRPGYLTGREIRFSGNARQKERIARFHAEGTRNMPRRDFFGLSAREARFLLNKVQDHYQRILPTDRRYAFRIRLF